MTFVLWEILIPIIIAFLLGLLFGWFMWGWRRTKITYTEWETMRQKANRSSSIETEAELAEVTADRDRLQAIVDSQVSDSSGAAEIGAGVLGVSGAAALAGSGDDEDAAADATADAPAASEGDAASGDATDEAEAAPSDEAASDEASDADADAAAADATDDAAAGDASGEREVTGERHPYGEGSHGPFADDPKAQPEGYDIKGNADSMLYHRPDSRSYKVTIAEVWFDTAERAEAAGFGLANSHPKDKD